MMSTPVAQPNSTANTTLVTQSWLPALAVSAALSFCAPRVLVGADAMWMVALGDEVASTRSVPSGVPFAAADTTGWANVPVLGELTMHAIHALGPTALPLALFTAGTTMLMLLARGARHEDASAGAA